MPGSKGNQLLLGIVAVGLKAGESLLELEQLFHPIEGELGGE